MTKEHHFGRDAPEFVDGDDLEIYPTIKASLYSPNAFKGFRRLSVHFRSPGEHSGPHRRASARQARGLGKGSCEKEHLKAVSNPRALRTRLAKARRFC